MTSPIGHVQCLQTNVSGCCRKRDPRHQLLLEVVSFMTRSRRLSKKIIGTFYISRRIFPTEASSTALLSSKQNTLLLCGKFETRSSSFSDSVWKRGTFGNMQGLREAAHSAKVFAQKSDSSGSRGAEARDVRGDGVLAMVEGEVC
jgi:hypothetical protein